jgi:UPF0176 protein
MADITVAAFYKFTHLPDYQEMRQPIYDFCFEHGMYGTILLAEEGINSTISGPEEAIQGLLDHLKKDPRLADIKAKFAKHHKSPFRRLRVRLKKEIVTIGVPGTDPLELSGHRVEPKDWNNLIAQEDVILIDTRNDYEFETGTFEGAVDPKIDSFGDFPGWVEENLDPKKHKKVAMFCTGGIRCEKASAYMLKQGYEDVYQLEGGILRYIEETKKEESSWKGDCFVFDYRVCVNHDLAATGHTMCEECQWAIPKDQEACPHCGAMPRKREA